MRILRWQSFRFGYFFLFITMYIIAILNPDPVQSTNLPESSPSPSHELYGTAYSPAHMPNPSPDDIRDFFREAKHIGNQVLLIVQWDSLPRLEDIRTLQILTQQSGMKFHLQFSPISLYDGRKTPAIPKNIGGKSFKDVVVQRAFKKQLLEYAALRPDYLGLGTEVNLLAQNPGELQSYLTLTRETYRQIKQKYPSLPVTISFQWDVLLTQKQFAILDAFKNSLDIYSLTTYPSFFKDPSVIPADYYICIRKLLPTQRIGFSELGWNSRDGSDEEKQAGYLERLPELMKGVQLEYIIFGLLHDVSAFKGDLSPLNSVGLRNNNGTPKKSWNIVLNLAPFQ